MAAGHRERLRKRFESEEIDDIPEYIVLEMMLTGTVRRRDTCEIARELIAKFGNLANVIDAPEHELLSVEGMGKSMIAHIKLIPKFYRKYRLSKWESMDSTKLYDNIGDYLLDKFIGYDKEVFLVVCMDAGRRVIACRKVFEGNVNSVNISIRALVDIVLQQRASRVVIAHNHLSGNALPSSEDLETTRKIKEALEIVGVILEDHIIVADDDYVSFLQSGFFSRK